MVAGKPPGKLRSKQDSDVAAEIQVNDTSKVSEVDPQRYEEVPAGGGRFSAWRRRVQVMTPDTRSAAIGAGADSSTAFGRGRMMVWGGVGTVLVAAMFIWVVFFSPLLAVRSIEVQGAKLTNSDEVYQHLEHFEGTPMAKISEGDVMESLGDLPQVRSVHVMTMPDNRLVVDLTERVPVAAVQDGQEWKLVDQEAKVLRSVKSREELNVPLVEGGTDVLGSGDFEVVSGVLSTLPASLLEQVDSAKATSDSTVELQLDHGLAVRWGDSTQSSLKAEVLGELITAKEQTGPVTIYDVSSPQHPVLE